MPLWFSRALYNQQGPLAFKERVIITGQSVKASLVMGLERGIEKN
jgi:hypothetical protein